MQSYTLNRPMEPCFAGCWNSIQMMPREPSAAGVDGRSDGRNPAPHLGSGGSAGRTAPAADRAVPLASSWPLGWRPCVGSGTAAANGWCCRTGTSSPGGPVHPAWPAPRWTRRGPGPSAIDLRHDYVLRQLNVTTAVRLPDHGLQAAMNVHFAAYLTEKNAPTKSAGRCAADRRVRPGSCCRRNRTPRRGGLWLLALGLQVERRSRRCGGPGGPAEGARPDRQVRLDQRRPVHSRSCARRRRQRRSGS